MANIEKTSHIPAWQQELQTAFTDVEKLLSFLELDSQNIQLYKQAAKDFPLLVTYSYAKRIQKGNWSDPLLRQVLPHPKELEHHPSYLSDPVGDKQASISPGLIHKYHGRALIIMTSACAIHCRYCFRREFPYSDNTAHRSQLLNIKQYLLKNPEITELILSGGDPLTLSDAKFSAFITALSEQSQIKRIRIHTRLPVVLPSRVTPQLIDTLSAIQQKIIIVIHANHPNEIDDEVSEALSSLKNIGVTLLNQTVLLKGVNDDSSILVELSNRLFEAHTLPYYLHTLDKVSGAMHFDSNISNTLEIYQQIQKKLPGYLVPKLVQEEAGKPYKTILSTNE